MKDKLLKYIRMARERIAKLNIYVVSAVLLVVCSISLLAIKAFEFEEQRREEIQNSQFHYSKEIAFRLSAAADELVNLVITSSDKEDVFHNEIVFRHSRNNEYNANIDAEIAKLKLTGNGRFNGKDARGKSYNAKTFSLESFPVPGFQHQWTFNPGTNSATLVAPTKSDVYLVNVPVQWFVALVKTNNKTSDSEKTNSIQETFDWAIIHSPANLQPAASTVNKDTILNLLLATSDSMLFTQATSKEIFESGLQSGPARYMTALSKMTELIGLSVIPLERSNLRLVTRWSAKWGVAEFLRTYGPNILILLSWVGLFGLAAIAFKFRFKKLTEELRQSLAQLNPSRSMETMPNQPKTLEDKFNDIYESAVWLYRLASQRQQKYSELSGIVKSCANDENIFLVYIDKRLEAENYSVQIGENNRWRICFLRSPYLQNPGHELVFALSAEGALARIIMYLASNYLIEQTAKSANLQDIARNFEDKLQAETLRLKTIWLNVPTQLLLENSFQILNSKEPANLTFSRDATGVRFHDIDGEVAFEFTPSQARQKQTPEQLSTAPTLDKETTRNEGNVESLIPPLEETE